MTRILRRVLAGALATTSIMLLSFGQVQAAAPRIIGGSPIDVTSAPWQVLLRINNATQCGGSIIADTWILTAAHCVLGMGPSQIEAFVGVTDQTRLTREQKAPVSQVIVNPGWDPATYSGDLALIGLTAPISKSSSVQPIAIPLTQNPLTWPAMGEQATISGWGTTSLTGFSVPQLRAATVQILTSPTDFKCGEYGTSFVPANHVCAGVPQGGVDVCQGDSGGPLTVVSNGTPLLAGVVSAGSGCADPRYPGLYTRVTSHLPWLRSHVPLGQAPPEAPKGVLTSIKGSTVTVTWLPPSSDGGTPVTSYTATSTAGGLSCKAAPSGPALQSCTATGAKAGTNYAFTVVATNNVGTGPASAASSPNKYSTKPSAPLSVKARASGSNVTISWKKPKETGGLSVQQYIVSNGAGAGCVTSSTQCVVKGLNYGTKYKFNVKAVNGRGVGPAAVSNAATTGAAPVQVSPVAPEKPAPVLS